MRPDLICSWNTRRQKVGLSRSGLYLSSVLSSRSRELRLPVLDPAETVHIESSTPETRSFPQIAQSQGMQMEGAASPGTVCHKLRTTVLALKASSPTFVIVVDADDERLHLTPQKGHECTLHLSHE